MPKTDEYQDNIGPLSTHAEKSLAIRRETISNTNTNTNDVSASIAATANAGAITASQGVESQVENTNTDWVNKKWRPVSGWAYLAICVFDFIIAPILWSVVQVIGHGTVSTQWQPLTLQGGGLIHVSFGALLGITSWGRTKEKLASKE